MRILATLLILIFGVTLTLGGGTLLSVGGSAFYLFSGLVLLAVTFGLIKRKAWATTVYAVWMVVLLVWSLVEAGLHWWPLATRVGVPALIGLLLALPSVRRPTNKDETGARAWPVLGASLLAAVVAFIGIARPTHEIDGELTADADADAQVDQNLTDGDWNTYAGSNMGQRYSPLTQITKENVKNLAVAWQIQTGDIKREGDIGETTYQVTPIKVGNTLFMCTPHNIALALDADTGKELWRFDPQVGIESGRQHQTCRGVTYLDASTLTVAAPAVEGEQALAPVAAATHGTCATRIYLPTSDSKVYALDATTGEKCTDFGKDGAINLMANQPYTQPGYFNPTSAPVLASGKLIVNGSVNDNYDINEPSGVIRAYDPINGKLLWNFDSGNPSATAAFDENDPTQKYTPSSPNSWSAFSADEKLGLVYLPMGNRTPDQVGVYRNEHEEKYATSVVALDINTGEARWVHQFVHHDLWDMDTPAQPVLIDLDLPQGKVPALVQPTKQGDVYVLDRRDGSAILPVGERPAPQGTDIPGEFTAATQPYSSLSFEPPALTEASMWGATLIDQMMCRIQFRKYRYEGRYTAPSQQGTIVYPGNFGVFNWGSVAVDPKRQVMFGMPTYLAFVSTMVSRKDAAGQPANLGEQGLNLNEGGEWAVRMHPFLSFLGVPCQQPPWGTVAAADLRTGKIAYQHRNGTIRDLSPIPLPITVGVPGIGGPMITAGGLAFLGAAVDDNFRAYDLNTGKVLWDVRLPAGGQATPMSYLNSQGEQMVLIVAGGHGSVGTTLGDYVVAYKLKK